MERKNPMDEMDEILSHFTPDENPDKMIRFEYVFDSGFTVSGTVKRAALERLFRDPSNLQSVITEIPAGTAIAVVLPPAQLIKFSHSLP
jgi:hypothetical protein